MVDMTSVWFQTKKIAQRGDERELFLYLIALTDIYCKDGAFGQTENDKDAEKGIKILTKHWNQLLRLPAEQVGRIDHLKRSLSSSQLR